MSITVIFASAVLAALILYFLINAVKPLKNKLNQTIKLTTQKRAYQYIVLALLGAPLIFLFNQHEQKIILANEYGFETFEQYQAEIKLAQSYDLTLVQYQSAMQTAKAKGIDSYADYQNYLTAKEHGYQDYADYNRDVKLAKSYGFSLSVYRAAKAEADRKNFQYFDDYLIQREQETLATRLIDVAKLNGDYNIENVPLGAEKSELLSLIEDCKISQMPNYSFPVTKTLAPRNNAMVSHFFPETSTNANFGLTAYTMNFSVMPGLDLKAISKYEMKCEESRYDLWFLKSDDRLVMYEKTFSMPNIRKFETTVAKINDILAEKCDSEIEVGLETEFEENGTRAIKNLYCKSFEDYIIATIVDGPIITGVRQEPDIHIGYLNNRLWKKYINNLHAIKGKEPEVRFSQNNNKTNQTKTIENRI